MIEIGPGDGSLAAAVLRQLDHARWLRPWSLLEPRARLHLVDVDSPLRDRQTVRLARFRRRVRWHCSVANALAATGGRALIWSNELVDAFPARVLRWADGDGIGRWQELWVETDAGGLREIWLNFDSGSLSESASAVDPGTWPGGRPPDGQRIEVHESFAGRLREWVPRWRCGSMLTIDYGEEFPAVYHRRPGGTLRAYAHQQRLEGASVYHRMGRQDLTADVNFTDLLTWTQALGLETVRLLSQGEFIGFMAASDGAADTRSEAVGEAEQAFKVLWQRRPAGKTGADGGASG